MADGYVNEQIAYQEDEANLEGVKARLAALEWPNLVERTLLHHAFNSELKQEAEAAGFGFRSDFDALTRGGPTLDPVFIPFGQGREHHLDLAPTETILAARIWELVDQLPSIDWPPPPPRNRAERLARKIGFIDLSEAVDPAVLPWLDHPDLDCANLSPEQKSWRDDGVVELKNFLPCELINAYVERRRVGAGPAGWLVPTPYLQVPELRALALYRPLTSLMESLIGEPMMLHLALTAWISTQRDWHQDDYLNPPFVSSWYAAVWIALDDIDPDCGPFEYLPGSHRWPLLRIAKVKSFLTDEELARREPVTGNNDWPKYAEDFVTPAVEERIRASGAVSRQFLGKRGDVLIWHGRLMHRGMRPRIPDKERRSLITHYSGESHRPDMPDRRTDPATGGLYAYFDHPLHY